MQVNVDPKPVCDDLGSTIGALHVQAALMREENRVLRTEVARLERELQELRTTTEEK